MDRRIVFAAVFLSSALDAAAQGVEPPTAFDVPFAPMHAVPIARSLPGLVADRWQIVGVSLRERTFAYHLVKDGELVLCLADVGGIPPGSECMRIADGRSRLGDGGRPVP